LAACLRKQIFVIFSPNCDFEKLSHDTLLFNILNNGKMVIIIIIIIIIIITTKTTKRKNRGK